MRATLFTLTLVLFAQVSFAGWLGPSTKPLTVQEAASHPTACRAIDSSMTKEVQATIVRIDKGEIQKGTPEASVAIAKAMVKGYDKEGYSLDATLLYCFSQQNTNFWARFYGTYGESLNFFIIGLQNDVFRKDMLANDVLSEQTIAAWGAFKKWEASQ